MTPVQHDGSTLSSAAIAFADVVGFTALTAEDELGMHRVWTSFQSDCLRPALSDNRGSLIKTLGDGALVVFETAGDAMRWAMTLQGVLAEDRAAECARWPRLRLRIGVHRGEIYHEADDVHGGNVNIAKRIQEAATPDSILFTEAVASDLASDFDAPIVKLGYLTLKGDPVPVQAFAINPGGAPVVAGHGITRLPTVAVLPFVSLGGREEDVYFADGFVEDVITSLSGLHELQVIARSSTLAFRDRLLHPKEAMSQLGARYILQGTLRRMGARIRVSTALVDCKEGTTLFSTRRDLQEDTIFEEQDRLVNDIVRELAPQIQRQEVRRSMRKPTHVFSAYDHGLRALHHMQSLKRLGYEAARAHLDAAIAADPDYAKPYALKCQWHTMMIGQGWHTDRALAARQAEDAARKAIERDNNNVLALCYYGHSKAFLMEDFDTAQMLHERSRQVCPNHAPSWMLASATLAFLGRGADAVASAERALELSPIDLDVFQYHHFLAFAHFSNRALEAAVFWAQRSRSENADYTSNLKLLAAALAGCDRLVEARDVAAELMRLEPSFRLSSYTGSQRPFRDPSLRIHAIECLQRAGVPD